MKTFTKLLVVMMLFLSSLATQAQDYVQIGSGYNYGSWPVYYVPWGNYWHNQRCQTLYYASEIGSEKIFEEIAWRFYNLSGSPNYLLNVHIKIKETTLTALPYGSFQDMSTATTVFEAANLVPATSIGWQTFDIDDYPWDGTNNIIIEVQQGDNGYYAYPYYRTYATADYGTYYRTLAGYSDWASPAPFSGGSYYYDDIRIYYRPFNPPGDVEGYVFNYDGLPVNQATVGVAGQAYTTTDPTGYYFLAQIRGGMQEMTASKEGYNTDTDSVNIISGGLTYHEFTLTQPTFIVNPLSQHSDNNPNEYVQKDMYILNNGSGNLHVSAVIEYLNPTDGGTQHTTYIPAFTGEIENTPVDAGLAPKTERGQGFSGNGSRGSIAFGNDALVNEFWDFDIEDLPGYTVVGSSAGAPDFINGMAFPVGEEEWAYGIVYGLTSLYRIERADGALTNLGNLAGGASWNDITIDPTDGTYYATGNDNLYTFDPGSMTATLVGSHGSSNLMIGIACDENGDLWGYDLGNDQFYSIDKATGSATSIGAIGFNANYAQSMFYDPETEKIIMAAYNASTSGAEIREVDVTTGASVILSSLSGSELTGTALPISGGPGPITGWLSLDYEEADVPPFGGSFNMGTNYDATGIPSGTTVYANIIFTSDPNVGTITVPCSMTVMGDPLGTVDDLTAEIVNMITGRVKLEWTGISDRVTFQHYEIRRNDYWIANTNNTLYYDMLPDYGDYCYTVQAVYDEGKSAPAGPACVEWYIPTITVDPMAISASVVEGEMVEVTPPVAFTITNTGMDGSKLQYTISFDASTTFIESVIPMTGELGSGDSEDIRVIYNSEGYTPGVYTDGLDISSNDPNNPTVTVDNEMTVIEASHFTGQVFDGNTGIPLPGVNVIAGQYMAITNENGVYDLKVTNGTYDVEFNKLAFQPETVIGETIGTGDIVTIDMELYEMPYPPQEVTATVDDADENCLVEWTDCAGPYEIFYDDGSMEDMYVWSSALNQNAVKFTPQGYPANVYGGRIYIGNGYFPPNADLIGTTFGVAVYDDDGTGGMPGTMLDSIEVVVDPAMWFGGWIEFEGLGVDITDGDFYIAMVQGDDPPNTAGIGLDTDMPHKYRSYQKMGGGDWQSSTLTGDFMIRAFVDGPVYPYTDDTREVEYYTVTRFANFRPDDPTDLGDATLLSGNNADQDYNDAAFGGLDQGWYKYGIKAVYTNGDTSDYAISNIVGHLMHRNVTFNVSTTDGGSPEGAELNFMCIDYPFETFSATVPADGVVEMEVWYNIYNLDVYLEGYKRYILNDIYVYNDKTIDVVLAEQTYPPRNLWVDPLTSIAYWNSPLVPPRFLSEDFEGGTMPAGWTTTSEGASEWYVTQDGGSQGFIIPAHTYYAVCNDEAAGSSNNGCCDYLITPILDLRDYTDYILRFQSFFTGEGNDFWGTNWQSAYVEYSTDGGETFDLIEEMVPASDWQDIVVDLTDVCGPYNAPAYTWLAFHADDNGDTGSGWAVDDVIVASASGDGREADSLMGYQVFLDGAYVASTPDTTYQYIYLIYGTTYTAGVAAQYSSGLSEMITYTFVSEFLLPPRNLEGVGQDDYAYLTWDYPNIPVTSIPRFTGEIEHSVPDAGPAPIEPQERQKNIELLNVRGEIAFGCEAINNEFIEFDVEDLPGYVSIGANTAPDFIAGMAFPIDEEDYAYGVVYGMTNLYQIDRATGSVTQIGPIAGAAPWNDITIDPTTGTYYATDGDNLYSFETSSMTATMIGAHGASNLMIGIACDKDGNLYAYDIGNDQSYSVDKATGAATVLGGIGFDANYAQSMFYDQVTDQILLGAFNNASYDGEIRILDETTGATTVLSAQYYVELTGTALPVTGEGPGPVIPENLLSYNIYRDGEVIDNVDKDVLEYYDFDLEPGTYMYSVTALYDLQPYGFPGEIGESMHEGPVEVVISYGYPLPFMEDWESATFEFNEWYRDCDNWEMSSQEGNPAPSAKFAWDDPLYDYRCELTSYPLLGSDIIDGDIYLDFDLKLEDRKADSSNDLTVAVWENGVWHEIDYFTNEGSFDWTSYSYKITDAAKGNDFRVGFIASGDSSVKIFGWYVDNIHVYRVCAAPIDFQVNYDEPIGTEAEITWIPPGTTYGEWISYNDGTFENGLASSGGGYGLAQLFTPPQYPVTITKVRWFYSSGTGQEEVYVLTGDGAEILGGPYYFEDNGAVGTYVEMETDPISITEGTFMIATINTAEDGPYVGVDDSYYDGTLYYGTIGDWTELSELGDYFYIGSHETYVEWEVGDNVVANSDAASPAPNANSQVDASSIALNGIKGEATENGQRDFLGVDIYRSHNMGEYIKLNEEPVEEPPYIDPITTGGDYCYYTVAIYDQCEGISDTICIESHVGIENVFGESSISVYPNPAQDLINVESTYDINKITVMNYVGQTVEILDVVEDAILQINTASYEDGVYFLKIETDEGVLTKKVTIAR